VHPRRTDFFKKIFGFEVIGQERAYHRLRKAEVILLHADGQHFETLMRKATHEVYYHPTELKFDRRFQFSKTALLQSTEIGDYFISFLKKLKKYFSPPEKLNFPLKLAT